MGDGGGVIHYSTIYMMLLQFMRLFLCLPLPVSYWEECHGIDIALLARRLWLLVFSCSHDSPCS